MEDIQIAVESILRRCKVEELAKIAMEMRIAATDVTDKSKLEVMRVISQTIDGLPDDDQKLETMKRMLPGAPKQVAKDLCDVLLGTGEKQQDDRKDDTVKLLQALSMNAASTFRRECKITGVIGEEGDEGNLDYVSLCGKIEDARKKKYTDPEIAMAVKNIVSPGSDLRTYLDAKSDMDLTAMLKFIGNWRKEKSAAEMHKMLEKAFQGPTEDTVKFAVRLMKLREKIVIAATAEGSRRYQDEETLHDDFLHALRTGLRDSDTKARMGAFIVRGARTSDNTIMEQLKEISAEEEEGKLKRGEEEVVTSTKRAKVNEVSVVPTVDPVLVAVVTRLEQKVDNLNNELKVLRDEEKNDKVPEVAAVNSPEWEFLDVVKRLETKVDGLTSEVAELRSKKDTQKKYGCEHCKQQGQGSSCRHCFFCGAGDHKIQDCLKKKKSN